MVGTSDIRKSDADPDPNSIARRIQERMRERGMVKADGELNYNALAAAADRSYGTVYPIAKGLSPHPRADTIMVIAKALRTDPMYLYYGQETDETASAFYRGVDFALAFVKKAVARAEKAADRRARRATLDKAADVEDVTSGAPLADPNQEGDEKAG